MKKNSCWAKAAFRPLASSLKCLGLSLVTSVLFSLCFVTFTATAQEFSIKKIELTSENVILYYDLIDTVKNRTYTINVFTSRDSYLTPIQKVKGDAGLEVRPGANKKIVWSSKEELGQTFHGDIELEVRGRVYIPFVKFEGFQDGQVFKRGKAKTLTWAGGTRQNILNFTLYKGEEYNDVIPNVANSGSYDMVLPTSVKPGSGYYFLVSDSKNKDQVMKTNSFGVMRKISLGAKIVVFALIGASIPILIGPPAPENIDEPPPSPESKN